MIEHKNFTYIVGPSTGNIAWYDELFDNEADYIVTKSLPVADMHSLNIIRHNYINNASTDMFNGLQATKREVLGNEDIVYIDEVSETIRKLLYDYPEDFI